MFNDVLITVIREGWLIREEGLLERRLVRKGGLNREEGLLERTAYWRVWLIREKAY